MIYPHKGQVIPPEQRLKQLLKQLSAMAGQQGAGAAAAQVAFNKGLPLSVSVERQAAFVSAGASGDITGSGVGASGDIANNQLVRLNGDTLDLALGRLERYVPYTPEVTLMKTNVKRDFHAQMQYEIDQWLADVRKGL